MNLIPYNNRIKRVYSLKVLTETDQLIQYYPKQPKSVDKTEKLIVNTNPLAGLFADKKANEKKQKVNAIITQKANENQNKAAYYLRQRRKSCDCKNCGLQSQKQIIFDSFYPISEIKQVKQKQKKQSKAKLRMFGGILKTGEFKMNLIEQQTNKEKERTEKRKFTKENLYVQMMNRRDTAKLEQKVIQNLNEFKSNFQMQDMLKSDVEDLTHTPVAANSYKIKDNNSSKFADYVQEQNEDSESDKNSQNEDDTQKQAAINATQKEKEPEEPVPYKKETIWSVALKMRREKIEREKKQMLQEQQEKDRKLRELQKFLQKKARKIIIQGYQHKIGLQTKQSVHRYINEKQMNGGINQKDSDSFQNYQKVISSFSATDPTKMKKKSQSQCQQRVVEQFNQQYLDSMQPKQQKCNTQQQQRTQEQIAEFRIQKYENTPNQKQKSFKNILHERNNTLNSVYVQQQQQPSQSLNNSGYFQNSMPLAQLSLQNLNTFMFQQEIQTPAQKMKQCLQKFKKQRKSNTGSCKFFNPLLKGKIKKIKEQKNVEPQLPPLLQVSSQYNIQIDQKYLNKHSFYLQSGSGAMTPVQGQQKTRFLNQGQMTPISNISSANNQSHQQNNRIILFSPLPQTKR